MEFVPVDLSGDFAGIARRNYNSDTRVRLVAQSPTHTISTERNANQRTAYRTFFVDSLNTPNIQS